MNQNHTGDVTIKAPHFDHKVRLAATRRIALLSIATSLVTLGLKFGAYFLTDSVSLLSDALEALVNLAAGLVALAALTIAARPADDQHAYGHDKAEYFSSGVEGALILVAAISIIYTAVDRFMHPAPLDNLGLGILVATLAGIMNFLTARVMLKAARQHDSVALEGDAKHLLTDVWTSVGILGGLVIVLFMPTWIILDPLLAIVVGLHIIFTGIGLIRRSADGLMDAAISADELALVEQAIRDQLSAGISYHNLRTRKAGSRQFIELDIVVPGTMTVYLSHQVCDLIEDAIRLRLPRASVTIHVEPAE